MAFAQKRDTVCPGQKLTQLEGPLLAAQSSRCNVLLDLAISCWLDIA